MIEHLLEWLADALARPPRPLKPKVHQHLVDADIVLQRYKLCYRCLPGVLNVTLGLLLTRGTNDLSVCQPPRRSGIEQCKRFRPELIPVALDCGMINFASTADRPEAAATGFVFQVGIGVGAADKNGLARHLDDAAPIAWTEAVNFASDEGLHLVDIGAVHAGEFWNLYSPGDADLHSCVFAAQLGEIVREPW